MSHEDNLYWKSETVTTVTGSTITVSALPAVSKSEQIQNLNKFKIGTKIKIR